jgi:hypothetical protein
LSTAGKGLAIKVISLFRQGITVHYRGEDAEKVGSQLGREWTKVVEKIVERLDP